MIAMMQGLDQNTVPVELRRVCTYRTLAAGSVSVRWCWLKEAYLLITPFKVWSYFGGLDLHFLVKRGQCFLELKLF